MHFGIHRFYLRHTRTFGRSSFPQNDGRLCIYLNDKCVVTACDNIAFVKKLPCIANLMADAETGYAYKGAKEEYILDFYDLHKTLKVISTLWEELPFPKSRKK